MILSARDRDGAALKYKQGDAWREISYAQFLATARGIARGLIALGIEPGERISILADTRPEWTLADAGCLCAGAVVAPIYHTNSPEECEYVLSHSEARAVFCDDATQLAKIERVRERCPSLQHVISLNGPGPGALTVDELIELGARHPRRGGRRAGGGGRPRRPCKPRVHLRHDRAAEGVHAHPSQLDRAGARA